MSNETLNNSVVEVNPKKNSKKKIRVLDVIAYILCLLVAFGIWAYVTITENSEYEYQFTGVIVNLEGVSTIKQEHDLSPISGYGKEITITVKGSRSEILKYTSDDIFAYVNLSHISTANRHTLEVHVDLPEGIQFVSAAPSKINVFVDETVEKQVPIKVDLLYSALDNITVFSPEIDDEDIVNGKITVTGPKSVVDTIEHALITKDLGTVTTGVKFNSKFSLIDNAGDEVSNPYVKTGVNEVSVSVKATLEKNVPLVADIKNYPNDNYDYSIVWEYYGEKVENVKIVGEPTTVSGYEIIKIEIDNVSSIKNGNVSLPDDVSVYVGDNRISTISFRVVKTEKSTNG